MRNCKLLFVLLYTSCIVAFAVQGTVGQLQIDRSGHPHGRAESRYQQPKEIIDTMRLSAGVGYWVLSKRFTRNLHTTAPTASGIGYGVATALLTDTTAAVNSYAVFVNANKDTLVIKSSSATDSGLVVVRVFIK